MGRRGERRDEEGGRMRVRGGRQPNFHLLSLSRGRFIFQIQDALVPKGGR